MQKDKDKTLQFEQKDVPWQRINLSDYAGDEEDYAIAAEQANDYCEDCERAIGADRTTIKKDVDRSK